MKLLVNSGPSHSLPWAEGCSGAAAHAASWRAEFFPYPFYGEKKKGMFKMARLSWGWALRTQSKEEKQLCSPTSTSFLTRFSPKQRTHIFVAFWSKLFNAGSKIAACPLQTETKVSYFVVTTKQQQHHLCLPVLPSTLISGSFCTEESDLGLPTSSKP